MTVASVAEPAAPTNSGVFVYEENDPVERPALDAVAELECLEDGWNGPRSKAPSRKTFETARRFASSLRVPCDAISPTDDGEIMFEWQTRSGSVYAHVHEAEVWLVLLGETKDQELSLPPDIAAEALAGIVRRSVS